MPDVSTETLSDRIYLEGCILSGFHSAGVGSMWLNNPTSVSFSYVFLRSSLSKLCCFLLLCTCDGQ